MDFINEQLISFLKILAQKDPDERRQALIDTLGAEGFSFTTQGSGPEPGNPRGTENILLAPWCDEPSLLFGAHYDAVPGSYGANDNAAAVAILIMLAKTLRQQAVPARFAFFDGEETDNSGSRLYVSEIDRPAVTGYVNLDICGFGDTIAICGKGHENKAPFRAFSEKSRLQKHNAQVVRYLPQSDEISFAKARIPAISVCIVPRWDVQYLKALASYEGSFLGRPPEFDMILSEMEVITTMHGGYRDDPEYIEAEAMRQVYEYLLDAVTSAPGRKISFFSR
ncbi:MAG: M28 family metallopeptidase [Clostridiales bacterium]|nr:M28 family metallopeptidase [Clostridiales bacterium]